MIKQQARGWDEIRARLAVQVQPTKPALAFTSDIAAEYWRQEVALDCQVSLGRLRAICQERGADFDKTIAGLK
jgi:hypothetical protein